MAERIHVLLIDDASRARDALADALCAVGCRVTATNDADDALTLLTRARAAAVIATHTARLESGCGLLREARLRAPDALRFVLVATLDLQLAIDSLRTGHVHRFITREQSPASSAKAVSLALHTIAACRGCPAPASSLPARDMTDAGGPPTRVLVVDDDDALAGAITRYLHRHRFSVTRAKTGAEALRSAGVCPPDVAIVDIDLPDMAGFEVVRCLKQNHAAAVTAIVISGALDDDLESIAFAEGADDVLAKPFPPLRLLRRIEVFERMRHAYDDMHHIAERAQRLGAFADEVAALVAHDLNNGLTILTANLEWVSLSAELDSEVAAATEASLHALERMRRLVLDLQQISRLENDELALRRRPSKIRAAIDDTVRFHARVAEARNIDVAVDCSETLVADVDIGILERVVHNLLGNAVRFAPEGGTISISGAIDPATADLVIALGNDGPAIPDEVATAMFDKNATGGHARSQSGLGLYFCRLACEAHGGRIALAPTADLATNFEIRIPPSALDPREHTARQTVLPIRNSTQA